MKKLVALLLCLILFCFVACGNNNGTAEVSPSNLTTSTPLITPSPTVPPMRDTLLVEATYHEYPLLVFCKDDADLYVSNKQLTSLHPDINSTELKKQKYIQETGFIAAAYKQKSLGEGWYMLIQESSYAGLNYENSNYNTVIHDIQEETIFFCHESQFQIIENPLVWETYPDEMYPSYNQDMYRIQFEDGSYILVLINTWIKYMSPNRDMLYYDADNNFLGLLPCPRRYNAKADRRILVYKNEINGWEGDDFIFATSREMPLVETGRFGENIPIYYAKDMYEDMKINENFNLTAIIMSTTDGKYINLRDIENEKNDDGDVDYNFTPHSYDPYVDEHFRTVKFVETGNRFYDTYQMIKGYMKEV